MVRLKFILDICIPLSLVKIFQENIEYTSLKNAYRQTDIQMHEHFEIINIDFK